MLCMDNTVPLAAPEDGLAGIPGNFSKPLASGRNSIHLERLFPGWETAFVKHHTWRLERSRCLRMRAVLVLTPGPSLTSLKHRHRLNSLDEGLQWTTLLSGLLCRLWVSLLPWFHMLSSLCSFVSSFPLGSSGSHMLPSKTSFLLLLVTWSHMAVPALSAKQSTFWLSYYSTLFSHNAIRWLC